MNRLQAMLKHCRGTVVLTLSGLLPLWLIVLCWPYFFKYPVPDESTFLYEGLRVVRGDLPYRDFFNFIWPGVFYLVALIFKLTGVSLVAVRLVALGMVLGCIGMTLYIARFFLPTRWVLALGVFLMLTHIPIGIEIQHHLCSAFMGLVAVTCLWKGLLSTSPVRPRWVIASGIAMGGTAVFTQTLGALLGASLWAFLLLYFCKSQRLSLIQAFKTTILQFVIPATLPILGVFAWFWAQGAFRDLWQSTVLWVFRGGYADTTSHWYFLDGLTKLRSYYHSHVFFQNLHLSLFACLIVAYGALPVLGLLWPAEYFIRQWLSNRSAFWDTLQRKDWRLLFLWMAGTGFWMAIFSYPNTRMIAVHSWLLYILAWIALFILTRKSRAIQSVIAIGLLLFTVTYFGFETQKSLNMLQAPPIISYGTRERGLLSEGTPAYTRAFNQMVAYIRLVTPPGRSLFVYNQSPELYLITDRHNPTRFQLVMALLDTPDQIAEVAQDLDRKKPAMIIYNHLDELNFSYDLRFQEAREQHFDYHLHALESILEKDYQPAGELGNITLFRRKETFTTMPEEDSSPHRSASPHRE